MPELSSLPKYYTALVAYVDDAITALERGDDVKARALLIQGLGEAEEIYLDMWADDEEGEAGEAEDPPTASRIIEFPQ